MDKLLGKVKREKVRKQLQDDGHVIATKSNEAASKHVASKEKMKNRARKDSKRKKRGSRRRGSVGDESQEDDSDEAIRLEDLVDASCSKEKECIPNKECEEAVNEAVSDFFDSAWKICAERFFVTSAPVTVSVDLRNTWLRIVEAEWQEREIRGNITSGNNRIFQSDAPPLPLAFDSWSGGALEPLPRSRRESVMDPFLRNDPAQDGDYFPLESPPSSPMISKNENMIPDVQPQHKSEKKFAFKDEAKLATKSALIGIDTELNTPGEEEEDDDYWDFDLDQQFSQNVQQGQRKYYEMIPVGPEDSTLTVLAVKEEEPVESKILADEVQVLLAARNQIIRLDSTTDYDDDDNPTLNVEKSKTATKVSKMFSPSQCGGNTGSGIFRLFDETTSEALFKKKTKILDDLSKANEPPQILEKITLSSREIPVDDKAVVKPLFEEHTLHSAESLQRSQNIWGPSRFGAPLNGGRDPPLHETVSDKQLKKGRFLKRILINLHGRFKRQAIRSLAARATEAARMAERLPRSSTSFVTPPEVSKANITSKTRNNREESKTSSRNSVVSSIAPSQSVSSYSIKSIESNPILSSHLKKDPTLQRKPILANASKSTISQKMANVRSSRVSFSPRLHNTGNSRFQDSVIRTPGQVKAQPRFESEKRESDGIDKIRMGQSVLESTSVVSRNGYAKEENRRER